MEHRLQVYVGRDWLEERCAKMDGKFQYACLVLDTRRPKTRWWCFHGDVTTILSTTAGALMHGGHWLVMCSVMREVRDSTSCVSECHGEKSGAVKESLRNYNWRKDREQSETVAIRCDAVTSRMVQRLVARKHCHVKVTWLWLRQAMDEIELWNDVMWLLMNLMGMNLVAGVECLVQQPRDKTTGTMIPDRDMDHEKRNCQRGFEFLETIDGVRHEGNRSSIVEGGCQP